MKFKLRQSKPESSVDQTNAYSPDALIVLAGMKERYSGNSFFGSVTMPAISDPSFVAFDMKGDSLLTEKLMFSIRGQRPYGEWFKRLGSSDKPPRGKCGKWFNQNARLRG